MNVHFNPNVVISVEPILSSFPLIRLQSYGLSLISLCLEAALGDQVPACIKEKLQLLLFLVMLSPAAGGGVLLLPAVFFPWANKAEQVGTRPHNPHFATFPAVPLVSLCAVGLQRGLI